MSHAPDDAERSSIERMARIQNLDQLHRDSSDSPEGIFLKAFASKASIGSACARKRRRRRRCRDELRHSEIRASKIVEKRGKIWSSSAMAQAIEMLPDDPNQLKAMLLAERARNERLVQIIKELQRHRFGRRAETLPEDQMLLGARRGRADGSRRGGGDGKPNPPAARSRSRAPAPAQSRRAARPSAAHRNDRRYRRQDLPVLQGRAASDRRGCLRAARHRAGAVPRAGDAPAKIRLPRLRGARSCKRRRRRV